MGSGGGRNAVATQFGRNVRHYRRRSGLSQEDTAFRAGVHRTEVGLLERGERLPRIDTLVRMAAALSVSPLDLLQGIGWEPPSLHEGKIKVELREEE